MSSDLAKIEAGAVARDEWTEERIDLVKRTFCKGASDDEFALFLEVCRRTGLSPLARQIYAIMRKSDGKPQMTIQVGIDGFRLIADRTGRYVPGREASFTYDEKGKLATATAYVKKLVAGEWHEIAATVRWDEFAAGGNFWNSMPHHQLAKVAEVHALRRAFPADLSGLYAPEEMDQADRPSSSHVESTPPAQLPAQRATAPATPAQAPGATICQAQGCATPLNQAQYNLSVKGWGIALCPRHQKQTPRLDAAEPASAAQQERWKAVVSRARELELDIDHCRPHAGMSREDVEGLLRIAEGIVAGTEAGQQEVAA